MPTARTSFQKYLDSGWDDLLVWLPHDLDKIAAEVGSFQRRRAIRSVADLVRMALAYSVNDLSLRSTAAWAAERGIAKMSDVAVLGRLRAAGPLLERLLVALLARQVRPVLGTLKGWSIKLVDATALSGPGSTETDWRVHASFNPATGCIDAIALTDKHGGEHLGRFSAQPGDVLVADRGYAHEARLAEVVAGGAHFVVRIGHSAVPLQDEEGKPVDPLRFATRKRPRAGRPPRVEARVVHLRCDKDRKNPLRLVVVRKTEDAAERERARAEQAARKKGRRVSQRTLSSAKFTYLLTTLSDEDLPAVEVAELYRLRWQVELAFKRWKSLLGLDNLRAEDPALAKTYIYGKLIAAVLADAITRQWRAFSPYGAPLSDRSVAGLA